MAQMEENCKVLMGRYELGKLLGQGTFAKVYHGKNIQTGSSVAIKVILKHKVSRVEMMDQIKREISVMRLIRHPNVVELYEVMATRTKIYFVMEYVKGGELFNKVAKGKLKEDVARKYFQQLINAVDYCHSRGVYHRDLKPENLLLDDKENLKISDFGLSALAESKHQDGLLHTTCGTPAYVAPEVIHRKGYNGAKADIWSCGVILYVLLAGYLPFHDSNLMELYRKIGNAEFRYPNWFSPEVRRLLTKILDPNPNTRISIAKIMESSWFKKGYKRVEPKTKKVYEPTVAECDSFFVQCENPVSSTEPRHNHTPETCHSMNAFDIISFSKGFDLSSLFDEKSPKKEVRFSARVAASTIITKLEDVAKRLRIKVGKKDGGTIKFEREKGGRKGVLSFEAEIFEVTPTFHMVEMKKCSGDTIEYQKILQDDIRPALKDIIWTWQGDQEQTAHQGNAALPSPSRRTESW